MACMTDKQLADLRKDIEDGVSMIIACKDYHEMEAELNELKAWRAKAIVNNLVSADRIHGLQDEIPKLKGTCMCMDCGKTIKTIDQSKHIKDCEKKRGWG